jgi:anhydro-N-acetylmuramic acid kinase
LNALIGRDFAQAANEVLHEAALNAKDICAIGSHGQTVCHNTESSIPYTLQLGCGHTISSLTGITVIADFRTRDLVNGGQGAPFAPLYHQELFSKQFSNVALVNIGGIANITFINAKHPTRGWDVGPGNCLMDAWISKLQGKQFDANGAWAQQGTVIQPLLDALLADPFIRLAAPKSIGKEYFSLPWLESHLQHTYKAVDVQKTLMAFTAHPIADAMADTYKVVNELFLCGGGTHNLALKQMIQDLLPEVAVKSVAEVGISPDYLEAMLFAWLAAQTVNQQSVDLRAITGSKKPAILGAIYPSS